MFYVGLDIHSKNITICILNCDGKVHQRCSVRQVDQLMKLLRREGMHNPCFEVGRSERPLDGKMIIPGALDRDDFILNRMLAEPLTKLKDRQFETAARVENLVGLDEHLPVEVAEHPVGLCLAHVDTDNPKTFWADLLHP